MAPEPALLVSEWADRHRVLGSRGSAEPGPWRTARTPYLREIMDALSPAHPARRVVFMKGAQVGGPLALDTAIPTAEGWATMGALVVGDTLFDEAGRPCRVTGVSPIMIGRDCYGVTFDDGTRIVCDGDHRWPVWDFTDAERPVRRTLHTRDMVGRTQLGGGKRRRYAVDCCQPVELPDQDLLIHPYVLGVWLGDGSATMNHISVHEEDAEVADHLRACGVDAIFRLPAWRKGRCGNIVIDPTFRLVDDGVTPARIQHRSRFTMRLRMLDVLENKHVPAAYLRASRAQRLELIRGLMDSDGTISPDGKRCEFSNTDPGLIEGMVELLRSLGYKPTIYRVASRQKVINGTDRACLGYSRVSWTAYREEPMFRLSRKVARMRSVERGRPLKSRRRRIVSIEPVESVPVRCIEVDSPSHLYLCGEGWIPTHNTECGNNWIGYVIHHAPGPMLAVQPTTELAKRFSDQRIDPLVEETPAIRERVAPARSRDSGNRQLSKEFPGGQLVMTGANSAVGLRSMSARFLFLDEIDAYPGDVEGEGDPIALAEARARTFGWRRKMLLVSTPTIAGLSRIEREYLATDQRRYFVPCPHCGAMQWLRFERLVWNEGAPDTARYLCEACDAPIGEQHKATMLAAGEWRATATATDPHAIGFHISALYSPPGWMPWSEIARLWLAAQGDDRAIKTFRNTVLGETWQEAGEAPDWRRLYDRREHWPVGSVPADGLLLTAGVDVQRDRLEASIWAWGQDRQSWLVEHRVLAGNPFEAAVWDELRQLLGETWRHASGHRLPIAMAAIDSGDGMTTAEVYAFVRRAGSGRAIAVKGQDGLRAAVGQPAATEVRRQGRKLGGLKVWPVGSSFLKAETYGWLKLDRPTEESGEPFPPGYVHLPVHAAGEEFCRQLTAEQLVARAGRNGFRRLEWVKTRERNEALDCRVYARAAAAALGMDGWGEGRWARLADALSLPAAEPTPPTTPDAPAPVATRPRGWLPSHGNRWLR
nr:terminase gpA endonuclease subunit [Caldovatus sediminis]